MPLYEYQCQSCGGIVEILQKVNDNPPHSCPHCQKNGPLKKLLSQTAFQLKGSGWYKDAYSGQSNKNTKDQTKATDTVKSPPATSTDSKTAAPAKPQDSKKTSS